MDYVYEIQSVGTDENGIETMRGRVVIKGVTYKFSLYPTKTPGYRQRAHMSIISPKDGKVLLVIGEKREKIVERLPKVKRTEADKGKRIRELMATVEFFIATDDPKEIENLIIKKAMTMRGSYGEEIRAALGDPQDMHISADRAFQARGERFIEKNFASSTGDSAKANLAALEKLCYQLSEKAMCDVTEDDIHQFINRLSGNEKTRKKKLSLLSRFWDYCLIEGIINGSNLLGEYIKKNPGLKKRRSKRAARTEERPGRLDKKQEENLLQYVRGELDNGFSLSVPLMTGGGIPPTIQTSLTWSDVIIDQDDHSDVRVRISVTNRTWATQDYTRPLFRAEGAIVYERYEKLCKMFKGRDAVNELPIVSAKNDATKKVPTKEITAYIRDALLRTGVKNSALAPSANRDPRVGMGTQFLLRHYAAKLLDCGLETDKGLMDFLRLKRIASVTANHYRSFTSAEAQQYIRTVLDRYRGCDRNVDSKPIVKAAKRKEGKRRIWMERSDSPRCNKIEVSIVLGKGQELSLDSLKGIKGELFIRPVDGKESEEKETA